MKTLKQISESYGVKPKVSVPYYSRYDIKPYELYKPYEPYKPYTPYRPYVPYKPYKPYTPYTPYTPYKPYVPYKPYKPYEPYKPYVPYTPYTPPPPIFIPQFPPRLMIPKLKKFKKGKKLFKYQPSLVAVAKKIYGREPRLLTGLGIRPIT